MSSYYPAEAGRNLSTSRSMWSAAAVNSDSGSDNDFTKGKKRKPADNLLERIQKRLQNENFYDLNTSDEIGSSSPGHSGDASSSLYGRSRPQGYINQDSSARMRQQSGIVVPQAPSPPIISMQGEASAQSLSHAAQGSYAHQEMYKSDLLSQQQLGGNMYNYESAGANKQEASSRFGPPAKKPRTEADFSSAGGPGYPPSLSDFLAENFGVPADDLPLMYDKTQHPATAKEGAMLSAPAKYFSSKKSKFSSMDSDGRSATSNTEGYYSRDSSRVSASDQRRNSPLVDGRSSGSGIFVPARDRGGFNDSNPQSAVENAQNFATHHQSSQSSQNRQSFQFQGSSSQSKSSLDPSFSNQKSISSENIGGSSVWGAKESPFQGSHQVFSSSERFSQSEGFPRSHDSSSIIHRNGSGSRDDSLSSDVHGGVRGSFRTGSKGGDESLASFDGDHESLFQNSEGSRRGASTFYGGTRGRGELRKSFQSMSAVRGSQGARGASLVAARGSYQVTMSGDAWRSFSGGQNDSSYQNIIDDHGDSQGSFTGGQGDFGDSYRDISGSHGTSRGSFTSKQDDLSDSYHDTSNGRGASHGSFIGGRGDGRGSYRGGSSGRGSASSGRGTSRGSLTGGRGVSRGSYRGSRGIRGGDAQRGFRGGRGQFAGFPADNSIGRGRAANSYAGTNSGRGEVRGSFRGGRGVSAQSTRGGMTASSRGTGVSRGRGFERSASRERGGTPRNFQRENSEVKESSVSVPTDIKKSGFIVVDSYKTSSSEDFSSLPKEALQCSVCKIISFKSASAFKEHLESQHHAHMLTLLASRNDCLEQFIKMGAKLASRALEHEVISNSGCGKGKPENQESDFIMCTYCDCTVLRSALSMHNQLIQHKELMEFSKPLCCGIKFTKRQAYETHKVTRKHLTNKHQFEKLFVVNAVLAIEKEVLKSKEESISKGFTVKSLSLKQSEYVIKILQLLERNPVIENEKEDYCLACEVSVPRFRRSFHPCCSDHHANTVVFCSKNKIRLTARITQYLNEVRDRALLQQQEAPRKAVVGQSVTGSIAASAKPASTKSASTKSASAASSKPAIKSSTRAAASSTLSVWSSARNKKSLPSSVKDNPSIAKKPSKPLCEDKVKPEKCLIKDEENDVIDDEFDYEFSSVDIDDNKETLVKDLTSKDPVTKEIKETQDSEEECIDDEFAYEYDVSLNTSDVKPSDEKLIVTNVRSEVAKKAETPVDEDGVDDFEYEYAPVAESDSKMLDKNTSGSNNVASQRVDRKKDEVEEKDDEFDHQFEPTPAKSRDHSSTKLNLAKVVVDDQADDVHHDLDGINSSAIAKNGDQPGSQDANDDNDDEFDYEVADVNDDSTAVNEDHDCDILGDNDEFECEMKLPESREEEEEDEAGFEYDLPPESPKKVEVLENVHDNGENSNDESAFDYEMPNEQNVDNENIKNDPPASSVCNTKNSTVLLCKNNDGKETADVPDDKTNEVDDLVEEFDYEIVQDQTADSGNAEEEVDEDEFEYQCPENSTSDDKAEIQATFNSKEASSTEHEMEDAKGITISDDEKAGKEEEEDEVTEILSLKRKRPRQISGLDKSIEVKTEPKNTAEAGTRPKRRSIAPIRFE